MPHQTGTANNYSPSSEDSNWGSRIWIKTTVSSNGLITKIFKKYIMEKSFVRKKPQKYLHPQELEQDS